MRQRKIKDIEEKIEIFSEPLIGDPMSCKGHWREEFPCADAAQGAGSRANENCSGAGAGGGPDTDAGRSAGRRPLYLEIGCGKGRFITESALGSPDALYLGFEGQQSVLYRALQRAYAGPDVPLTELNAIARALTGLCDGDCARCGNRLPGGECAAAEDGAEDRAAPGDFSDGEVIMEPPANLRLCAEYILDMRDFFEPGELDGIFLNFSDPWPKSRQQKRRLTSPRYLDGYQNVLADGGFVRFKTDNDDFFEYSLACVEAHPGFEVAAATRDLHGSDYSAGNVMTEYEKRFLNLTRKISYLEAVKRR